MSAVIDEITIGGFGPIRDATLSLSPLHALIGPNDSGKSMTLSAVAAILSEVRSPSGTRFVAPEASWSIRASDPEHRITWKRSVGFSETVLPAQPWFGRGARLVRLNPDAMREAHPLLEESAPFDFLDEEARASVGSSMVCSLATQTGVGGWETDFVRCSRPLTGFGSSRPAAVARLAFG